MITLPREPQPGDALAASWGAAVVRYLRAITPRPSGDVLPSVTPGGATFAVRHRTRSAAAPPHAFQLIDASDGDGPKLRVHLDSWLMQSRRANDSIPITSLAAGFGVSAGDFIYLAAVVLPATTTVPASVTAASIEHGAAWSAYPEPFDAAGAAQTMAFRLVGYVQGYPGTGSEIAGTPSDFPDRLLIGEGEEILQVVQCLTTNLIVSGECESSETVVGLADWSAIPGPTF